MIKDITQDAEKRMKKSIESLKSELTKLRTGRAHTSLLDHVMVSYYGNETPLNQVASVNVSDPRTLTVTPWEQNMVAAVEKAIMQSNLGLNPAHYGNSAYQHCEHHVSPHYNLLMICQTWITRTTTR